MKKTSIIMLCIAVPWIAWNIIHHYTAHQATSAFDTKVINRRFNCEAVKQADLSLDTNASGCPNIIFKDHKAGARYGTAMINFYGDTLYGDGHNQKMETIQVVDSPVKFDKVVFRQGTQLSYKEYKNYVIYEDCFFADTGKRKSDRASFILRGCQYDSDCYLGRNDYNIPVTFKYDTFNARLALKRQYKGYANGHSNVLTFEHCVFKKGVQFDRIPADSNGHMATALDSLSAIVFTDCTIHGVLSLAGNTFTKQHAIIFNNVIVDSINLTEVITSTNYYINLSVPECISIPYDSASWAHWSVPDNIIAPFFPDDEVTYQKTKLNLLHTDVNKITFQYRHFQLYFDSARDEQQATVYMKLLDKYKKDVGTQNRQCVDVDYHNFQGGPANWLSCVWWNYGYNKMRVFIFTLFILAFFITITYYRLWSLSRAYTIDGVTDKIEKTTPIDQWRLSLIYTLIIFVTPMLEWEKLKFDNWRATGYILAVYAYGLIILYFILNFVVAK